MPVRIDTSAEEILEVAKQAQLEDEVKRISMMDKVTAHLKELGMENMINDE